MKNYKILFIILFLLVVLVAAYFIFFNKSLPQNQEQVSNNQKEISRSGIFATINGEEISFEEFDNFYAQMLSEQGIDLATLDSETSLQIESQARDLMISQVLLAQEAEKSEIVVSEEEISLELDSIRNQFPDIAEYEQALLTEGINEESLKTQISRNLIIQKFIDQELEIDNIEVTDEDAQTLYDQASSMQENFPPLVDIREQIDQTIIRQKQQDLINSYIEELKKDANIEVGNQ